VKYFSIQENSQFWTSNKRIGTALILIPTLVVISLPFFLLGTMSETGNTLTSIPRQEPTYYLLNIIYHIAIPLLLLLSILALYFRFKTLKPKLAATGTTFGILSVSVALSMAVFGFLLVAYSNSYVSSAGSGAQGTTSIVSSAHLVILILGVGEGISAFLTFCWILSISLIILFMKTFRSWIAYFGIAGAFAGPLFGGYIILINMVAPGFNTFFYTYFIFSVPGLFVTLPWFVIFGYKLRRTSGLPIKEIILRK
jgi:hypothetical protein